MWIKIKKYWPLLFILIGGFIAWSLLGRKKNPLIELNERKVEIDKKAKVKQLVLEDRRAAALHAIEVEHRKTIKALNADLMTKRNKMQRDPIALNNWLYELARD